MQYSKDIYTENPADPDTLANLGPLAPLAGTWYGDQGVAFIHPPAHRVSFISGAVRQFQQIRLSLKKHIILLSRLKAVVILISLYT